MMDVGIIGLGKMGGNISRRWVKKGNRVVGNARHAESVRDALQYGIEGAADLEELTEKIRPRRIIWMMIPSGKPVEGTIEKLKGRMDEDDILIDGGNSYYKDTQARAENLRNRGIHYIDVGTSGGIWGLKEGYSLMVGGEKEPVDHIRPLLEALAPANDKGWGHLGPSGSGHYVKMIHNGIEYGMMQSYAEGFDLLDNKREFNLDLGQVANVWRFGSVVRSWLLDLAAEALQENSGLENIEPYVEDSGEGRWSVMEAVQSGVSASVITESLFRRFQSRNDNRFSDRFLAVLRNKFGGHAVRKRKQT
jgi:6-phosphogluconate dehydrogenase